MSIAVAGRLPGVGSTDRQVLAGGLKEAQSSAEASNLARRLDEDDIDFANLETPQKVAQLPIMDPGFQLALALGYSAALALYHLRGVIPVVALDMVSRSGGVGIRYQYSIDLANTLHPVFGQGKVAGQEAESSVEYQEQGKVFTWRESIGKLDSALEACWGELAEGPFIKGKIGEVSSELSVTPLMDGKGRLIGYNTSGLLGGEPYCVDVLLRGLDSPERSEGEILVRGHADGDSIIKDYHLSIEAGNRDLSAAIQGAGLNAGMPQSVNIKLKVQLPEGS